MKMVSLKLYEELAAEADELSDKLNISRNRFINDAVVAYSKTVRRELLAKEMEAAAAAIKKCSREVIDEFDALEDEAI
jgi:metal-responsive CopG/Arc/MetJ family transcriptional regulator